MGDVCSMTDNINEDIKTEYVFNYGSNMLPKHLKHCKDIDPYSIRRGFIPGWRLSFSCAILSNKSDPCFANIVPHKHTTGMTDITGKPMHPFVNGCIIEINPSCFAKLDGYEFTYIRKQVEAEIYNEDGGGKCMVWAYVMDKQHEIYLNRKYPSQKYQFTETLPSKNYLYTLIEGSKAIHLSEEYIKYLKSQHFQNYLTLKPEDTILKQIHGTIFAMNDVKNWTNDKYKKHKLKIDKNNNIKGPIMVLKGIVFDLNRSPIYFQENYGGKDITLKQGLRWVHANEINTKGVNALENEQKQFINNVLMGALYGGSILGKCVGKLGKNDKYGYYYYNW